MCLPKPWNLVRAYAVGHSLCQSSPTDLGQWWLSECCRYRFASRRPQIGKRCRKVKVHSCKRARRIFQTEKTNTVHQPVERRLCGKRSRFRDASKLECRSFV